jgi:hypothetical protein
VLPRVLFTAPDQHRADLITGLFGDTDNTTIATTHDHAAMVLAAEAADAPESGAWTMPCSDAHDGGNTDATVPPDHGAFTQTGGLPLPVLLPPVGLCSLHCAVTPIDNRGRLADRSPVRAAGWSSSQHITIVVTPERVLIVRPDGPYSITRQGHYESPRLFATCAG